jgi:hypothetical protein
MSDVRTVLETLDRLSTELGQLRERREKIEERREQVSREIYLKLAGEYDGRIKEAEQSLAGIAAQLQQELDGLRTERERLADRTRQISQAIEELELRHYIGEYASEEDFGKRLAAEQEKRDGLQQELTELSAQLERAEGLLTGNEAVLPVVSDTQPLPAGPLADGPGTLPAAAPAADETMDIRSADELNATVAAPGDPNPVPVFGDAAAMETAADTGTVAGPGEAPPAAVTLNYLDQTRQVPIDGYPFTIGRSTKNALSLKSEEISRYHAQIRFEKGKFLLEDLGSANGTRLDGERVQRAELKPGGVIGLGPAELTFNLG